MRLLYTIGIYLTGLVLKVISLFSSKIKLGVIGRAKTFDILKNKISTTDKIIWMHCASLGEFEQGLPLLQGLKKEYKNYKIIVSFFSPSGYQVKKDTPAADVVVYLPLDTPTNAKRFLDIVRPELILFVKYEIWPNIILEAKKRKIQSLLISATFRPKQVYFKWYGNLMRKALLSFNHIFTQDKDSKNLIKSIGYDSVTVSGDTRFDRVNQQLNVDNKVLFVENFTGDKTTIVFGSSWPADDELFIPFINSNNTNGIKYIIAPHNIKPSYINSIKKQLKVKTICFSEIDEKNLSDYDVFILDTIGYLGRVYSYADIAYVGGGAGHTGLHNILEPAVFGIPIVIGKNYNNFPEAEALVKLKGVTVVKNENEFNNVLTELLNNYSKQKVQGEINSSYIKRNIGAVIQIMDYIRI
ncbi:3-deoxy-D-manno-octulosonic acid transferase [Winogradskyella sp. PC-19]|uniref:3-deoxy-D-manno-octulosonic acid transferase n=1 Tax=unclassified Winogradskyella TaxID=2615021 RepID=UPI000B3D2A2C|nr:MULTISPECIES: glycosyltransferase N-terminal domain-containing protein [unclassified Winogradskyella]ARV09392.1 3-deoxy-D-manno-octulosonic acid transferase [Winogradskyella sp. PC-19]RZN77368.1 MAG: 3-deoxy-D-manno-octulosonic acid transferase [Winogradskyella sp.]